MITLDLMSINACVYGIYGEVLEVGVIREEGLYSVVVPIVYKRGDKEYLQLLDVYSKKLIGRNKEVVRRNESNLTSVWRITNVNSIYSTANEDIYLKDLWDDEPKMEILNRYSMYFNQLMNLGLLRDRIKRVLLDSNADTLGCVVLHMGIEMYIDNMKGMLRLIDRDIDKLVEEHPYK